MFWQDRAFALTCVIFVLLLCECFVCLSSRKFTEFIAGEKLKQYFLLADTESVWLCHIYKHPVIHLMVFSQHTICLICYSSARLLLLSFSFPSLSAFLSFLFFKNTQPMSLFFLLRIRQAKVQILPERILPDPLSAVQLTPLSRLHMHPSSKPLTQSCKQAQRWWNNYQQVRVAAVLQYGQETYYKRYWWIYKWSFNYFYWFEKHQKIVFKKALKVFKCSTNSLEAQRYSPYYNLTFKEAVTIDSFNVCARKIWRPCVPVRVHRLWLGRKVFNK